MKKQAYNLTKARAIFKLLHLFVRFTNEIADSEQIDPCSQAETLWVKKNTY
jgi:hypothetical protein